MQKPLYILRASCPDRVGLVSLITEILYRHRCNIVSNHEFVEPVSAQFFMRTAFYGASLPEIICNEVILALGEGAIVQVRPHARKKLVVLATKEAHVLGDLLVRCAYDDLPADILAVCANHEVLEPLVKGFGLPFHFIPSENCERHEHETQVLGLLNQYKFDYLVLAKYMRVLNPCFVNHFPNRIINIHHSFLPAFVGANPYRQAYDRGVKIIGATAHFVNDQLDQGPIITQGVESVDHSLSPRELAKVGRDIEKTTLAKAVDLVCSDRVFISGNKTVVF